MVQYYKKILKKIINIFSCPVISCEVNVIKNDLVIFLFESNKCRNTYSERWSIKYLNHLFNLTICNADNLIIYQSKKTGTNLLGGLVIDLKEYDEGKYVFKINSQYFNKAFQFNKTKNIQ